VITAAIAVLIIAAVFFSLYVPLYASATPMVGDFPFFYFFLLIYMPVVGIVLGIVLFLQSLLRAPADADGPGADRPGADRPGADRPGADRPGAGGPGTGGPGAGGPGEVTK
jgi:hypothetical protein